MGRRGGREGGPSGINADQYPPVQIVERTRGPRDLVNAEQRLLPERALGRVGADGDYKNQ